MFSHSSSTSDIYWFTVIGDNSLWFVCLFNHLFGSANTSSSATGLWLDCCQATHNIFLHTSTLAMLCRSTVDLRVAPSYRVYINLYVSMCFVQPVKQVSLCSGGTCDSDDWTAYNHQRNQRFLDPLQSGVIVKSLKLAVRQYISTDGTPLVQSNYPVGINNINLNKREKQTMLTSKGEHVFWYTLIHFSINNWGKNKLPTIKSSLRHGC